MRATIVVLTCLVLVASAGPGAAQTEEEPGPGGAATIVGAGARPCSAWVRDRTEDGADANMDEAWVEGFLSALASALPHPDVLAGVSTPDVLMFMDGYCTENPYAPMGKAATSLFIQLKAHAAARQ